MNRKHLRHYIHRSLLDGKYSRSRIAIRAPRCGAAFARVLSASKRPQRSDRLSRANPLGSLFSRRDRKARILQGLILLLFSCLLLTGCTHLYLESTTEQLHTLLGLEPKMPKPRTPSRMTDIWTDTVLHQPGQPAIRGFGGRVMFYEQGKDSPIVVDGTFTVYVFDDEVTGENELKPLRKYVFLPEHLPTHYSRSKLGHSYSFWLPFDEVGNPRRQLSLVSRFQDAKTGEVIVSKVVHKSLPGPARESLPPDRPQTMPQPPRATDSSSWEDRDAALRQAIQGQFAVEHLPPTLPQEAPQHPPQKRIETTTIDVPVGIAQRMLGTSGTTKDSSTDSPNRPVDALIVPGFNLPADSTSGPGSAPSFPPNHAGQSQPTQSAAQPGTNPLGLPTGSASVNPSNPSAGFKSSDFSSVGGGLFPDLQPRPPEHNQPYALAAWSQHPRNAKPWGNPQLTGEIVSQENLAQAMADQRTSSAPYPQTTRFSSASSMPTDEPTTAAPAARETLPRTTLRRGWGVPPNGSPPLKYQVQRGPVVSPDFLPGRTQPHRVRWPAPLRAEPPQSDLPSFPEYE